MTVQTRCEELRERGLVERYVAGTLGEAETTALEEHYLTCPRCQEEVRLAAAIRAAPATPVASSRWRLWVWPAAAAAGIAGVLLLGPARTGRQLAALGAIGEAPDYAGVSVRAHPTRGDTLFEEAMRTYAARRWSDAVTGLEAAQGANADPVASEFFLGASLLMLDRNGEAAEAFRRVIGFDDTPYLHESRYYLAKALLRMGRGDEALAQLQQIRSLPTSLGREAAALADSVREM